MAHKCSTSIDVADGATGFNQKGQAMKKSYVVETSLQVKIEIDLGEIEQLIDVVGGVAEADGSNNWAAKDLARKLKDLRKDAVEEAKREFVRMADK